MKKTFLLFPILAVLAASCSQQPNQSAGASSQSKPANAAASPSNAASSTSQGKKDACAILTAAKIKELIGTDVEEGTSSPSNIGAGSTCVYKKQTASGLSSIIFQMGTGAQYYTPQIYEDAKSAGIGTQSFVQTPKYGNAIISMGHDVWYTNAGALKGDTVILLNINSVTNYTVDQVKALLKAVADQV